MLFHCFFHMQVPGSISAFCFALTLFRFSQMFTHLYSKRTFFLNTGFWLNKYKTNLLHIVKMKTPADKGFTVYTKSNCPFCDNVKLLLFELQKDEFSNVSVTLVSCDEYLSNEPNRLAFLQWMDRFTEKNGMVHRTFPMVFYQGKFIGGYTDTKQFVTDSSAFF